MPRGTHDVNNYVYISMEWSVSFPLYREQILFYQPTMYVFGNDFMLPNNYQRSTLSPFVLQIVGWFVPFTTEMTGVCVCVWGLLYIVIFKIYYIYTYVTTHRIMLSLRLLPMTFQIGCVGPKFAVCVDAPPPPPPPPKIKEKKRKGAGASAVSM